jgi:hypothetical protein
MTDYILLTSLAREEAPKVHYRARAALERAADAIEALQARVAELEQSRGVAIKFARQVQEDRDKLAAELASIKKREPDDSDMNQVHEGSVYLGPTPPVRESLSDAEIDALVPPPETFGKWQAPWSAGDYVILRAVARAIEAAIKEQK